MKNYTIKEFCERYNTSEEYLRNGGYLYLRGCSSLTSLPDGLTVGGSLYLRGTGITDTSNVNRRLSVEAKRRINALKNMAIEWSWDDRRYIKADGIFSVVDSHHDNVWRVHQLGSNKQMYIVTDGEHHYAHGDTIDEARTSPWTAS